MNIDLDYKTFCDTYYDAAVQVADVTIAEHIKSHGQLNPYIDVTLVKDLGISYGLERFTIPSTWIMRAGRRLRHICQRSCTTVF